MMTSAKHRESDSSPQRFFFFLAAAVAQVAVASLVVILETTEKHLPGKKRVITTKRLLTHSPRNDIIIRNVSKKLTRCLDEATSSTSFFFPFFLLSRMCVDRTDNEWRSSLGRAQFFSFKIAFSGHRYKQHTHGETGNTFTLVSTIFVFFLFGRNSTSKEMDRLTTHTCAFSWRFLSVVWLFESREEIVRASETSCWPTAFQLRNACAETTVLE